MKERRKRKGGRKDHTKLVEARAEVHGSCDLHWASVSISKSSPPTTTIEIKVTFFQSSFNSFLQMKWHDFFHLINVVDPLGQVDAMHSLKVLGNMASLMQK